MKVETVLWIDDEVHVADPAVRLLEFAGYMVECAATGAVGFDLLSTGHYFVIVLDLRLPDLDGLDLIERFSPGTLPPIVVVTGYGDPAACARAMHLGVYDFRSKPIWGEELVSIIQRTACDKVPRLLGEVVERSAPPALVLPNRRDKRRVVVQDVSISDAVAFICDPSSDIPMFMTASRHLRRLMIQGLKAAEMQVSSMALAENSAVAAAISRLQASESRVGCVNYGDIAASVGLPRHRLTRLLKTHTSFTFREWRWGATMQHVVERLVTGNEHVRQIGYAVGYKHATQLNRDFKRCFGLSPRAFRSLARSTLRGSGNKC